jgi:FkbM family methyltransferase
MNILGSQLRASDFIPPLINRVAKKIKGKITSRIPPFDSVPYELEAKWVLDVGANNGSVAIAALKSYRESHVICFEPVKETFLELKNNLQKYGERAIIYNQALSDKNGQTEIYITSFNGSNSIEKQTLFHKQNTNVVELAKETIKIVRLDDIAIYFPTRWIDIMKIDVEGHELNVLNGGLEFISMAVDTIIIEISFLRDISFEKQSIFEIFSLLNSCGFCLINIIDLYHSKDQDTLLVQMDCIFRHKSKLIIK